MATLEGTLSFGAANRIAFVLRRIHRWIALFLAVFMFAIGITGAILQLLFSIYGEPAPPGGGPPLSSNMPAALARFQGVVYGIHTMHYLGGYGTWYGIIMGTGLLFFSLSGLWMYLEMYRGRAQIGRRGVFWKGSTGADATMRSLHRWFAVALVLFTAMLGFTGGSLDFDFATHGMTPPGGNSGPGPGGGPEPGAAAPAASTAPGGPGMGRGLPGGVQPSGAAWHELNFTVHKLDFLGSFGHWLGVLIGLGLAGFAFSGIWMYCAMYARRAGIGRKRLFW